VLAAFSGRSEQSWKRASRTKCAVLSSYLPCTDFIGGHSTAQRMPTPQSYVSHQRLHEAVTAANSGSAEGVWHGLVELAPIQL